MKRKILLLFYCLSSFVSTQIFAQAGSSQTYQFLRKPANARVFGLGGENISISDNDVSLTMYNPALINSEMNSSCAIHYQPYLGDINRSSVAFGQQVQKLGTFVGSLQYNGYGSMDLNDESGNNIGTFSASEYAFSVGYARKQGAFTLGTNLKFAGSNIYNYSSYALLADFGAFYKSPKKDLSYGMLIKNAGFVLKDYYKTSNSVIPFDVQLGLSYKLEHMPLRISISAVKLYKYDIRFEDPDKPVQYDLNGNPITESNTGFDKIMRNTDIIFRHLVFGGEFLITKNVNFRMGYNHMMRREMAVNDIFSMAGFSFGGMIRIKGFEVAYTRSNFHIAGAAHSLGLSTNFNNKFKKKAVTETVNQ